MATDRSGHNYLEVAMSNTEAVRLTYINEAWNGSQAIRIQIKETSGHLRPGPEIPLENIADTVAAMINLMRKK